MTTRNIISQFQLLILSILPALTGCVSMGLAGAEAFTVGATATTAAVIAADVTDKDKEENVRIYGNYKDEQGFWLDKDKFGIFVIADSQIEAERIARDLSRESCLQRDRFYSILSMQSERIGPPLASILDSKYAAEIGFSCTTDMTISGNYSIRVTTENQDNSERLARELAHESCQNREEDISIIEVDNYLRPVSLLVLDAWYATDITFSCVAKTTDEQVINPNEPQRTPDNSNNRTEDAPVHN